MIIKTMGILKNQKMNKISRTFKIKKLKQIK